MNTLYYIKSGKLDNVKGRFFEDEAFEIFEDQLIEFEKKFPVKV